MARKRKGISLRKSSFVLNDDTNVSKKGGNVSSPFVQSP